MKKLCLMFSFIFLSTLNTSSTIGYCDIKGYVNNPGVYEIKENYTIQDVINIAGGLKKNAYTNNINLSKKVTDEMVIYIFNKNEIDKIKELNNCKCEPIYKYVECEKTTQPITTSTTTTTTQITTEPITTTTQIPTTTTKQTTTLSNKVNINTCTLEELIELNGLGEIKAKKIIEYREKIGLFITIEDILKVDGIGKTTFEKIKEFIEV